MVGRPGRARAATRGAQPAVVWHDLECGSYRADLPLWRELADRADAAPSRGPILDIGAGTGRVALELARRGHRVTALDLDAALLDALRERAAEAARRDRRAPTRARSSSPAATSPCASCRCRRSSCSAEPPAGSRSCAVRARHLRPGGLLACAIVTELEPFDCAAGDARPLRRRSRASTGPSTSAAPTRVRVRQAQRADRARAQRRSPPSRPARRRSRPRGARRRASSTASALAQLQREGARGGAGARWHAARSRATEEHAGSVVVMLRA